MGMGEYEKPRANEDTNRIEDMVVVTILPAKFWIVFHREPLLQPSNHVVEAR